MKNQFLLALALATLPGAAHAQSWVQNRSSGTSDPRLPSGIGVSPTVIAYGQPRFDPYNNPLIEDIVRVFEKQGSSFVEVAALQSSLVPASSASFGSEIVIEGNWLAIGDPQAPASVNFGLGAVHMYERGPQSWDLNQVIQPNPGSLQSVGLFGSTMDMVNGRLVVGAPMSNTAIGQIEDGAVFVYELVQGTWVQQQVMINSNPSIFSGFGSDVDLDANSLIIGSPGGDALAGNAGTAYVYNHNGSQFVLGSTIVPAQVVPNSGFGWTVAMEGGIAAVGAIGVQIQAYADGRVYVFQQAGQGWAEVAQLEDPGSDHQVANRFGSDLQIEGGSIYTVSLMSASASRYDFGMSGWVRAQRYVTDAGFTWPRTAETRVRAHGGQVVVSNYEGAVLFDRDVPAKLEINCDGVPVPNGSATFPILIDVRGELSFSENELPFHVANSVGLGPGLLFYGSSSTNIPFAAGGGNLCVAPPIARAALGSANQLSQVDLTLDLTVPPVSSGISSFGPGTTVYMQYWSRLTGGGSFLSNSLEMVFAP